MQLVFRFALNRAVIDTAISVVEFTHPPPPPPPPPIFLEKQSERICSNVYKTAKFLTTSVRCLKLAVLLKHIGYDSPVSNSRK